MPAEPFAEDVRRHVVQFDGDEKIAEVAVGMRRVREQRDVADDACNVEQVSEVYSTSGQYDLLMKCYLPDEDDIGHFVTEKVQRLTGVKDTFTMITFKAFT